MSNIELIKQLRSETGASLADIKEALVIAKSDLEAARAYLRKKGMAKAEKRSDKETKQGIIASYIHSNNKIGVLVEINCETDFVAKTEEFNQLGKDIAMQVCAMSPLYIDEVDIPASIRQEFEREVMNDPNFADKPEQVKTNIIDSKMKNYAAQYCLLKQVFFKDGTQTIEDLLKSVSGKLGEAIRIRRFVRFEVGE
ncbi:MAG: elongation factor Ts [Candidatus Dojkabacteria bacterium]|jgi:elongation factor Ts|nr:MAG: elongation factor Ts [Candidatus Dojkabacteria bacterium]